jgi:hypothetical protein
MYIQQFSLSSFKLQEYEKYLFQYEISMLCDHVGNSQWLTISELLEHSPAHTKCNSLADRGPDVFWLRAGRPSDRLVLTSRDSPQFRHQLTPHGYRLRGVSRIKVNWLIWRVGILWNDCYVPLEVIILNAGSWPTMRASFVERCGII